MKVSKDFGIVIRRVAVEDKISELLRVMGQFNFDKYFDESPGLISLGPFFGGDNADNCMKELEKIGLCYVDDFFIMEGFFPEWCRVEVFE